ncbi:MAG: LytTR family DNA-binding domain-containing protein [Clostridia bacterium]|nr:LytTR family DNA-binding domain-containing protein [Clostridia bacterium]
MLEIVLCEDDINILNYMSKTLEKIIKNSSMECKIILKASRSEDVEAFIQNTLGPNMAFFLDIQLKNSKYNGYDLAQLIREKERALKQKKSSIVFISDYYFQYLSMGYNVGAANCLKKPVSATVLEDCLRSIYEDYLLLDYSQSKAQLLHVKVGHEIYRIKPEDIIYINRNKTTRKTVIHTISQNIECSDTLDVIEEKLSDTCVVKCGKSYLVNKERIIKINENEKTVYLDPGNGLEAVECYYGEKYKNFIVEVVRSAFNKPGIG